jgi:hypothetical protein
MTDENIEAIWKKIQEIEVLLNKERIKYVKNTAYKKIDEVQS